MAKTLVLLRHAKSDYPPGVRDHDRPLAPRGVAEAAHAGDWIRTRLPVVDEILCSSAVRTQQTARRTGIGAPVRTSRSIYEASPGDILEEIGLTAESVATLLVVGHAPGIPALALDLAGPDSDPGAVEGISDRFPTSALAVLTFDGGWAELTAGSAILTTFHIARG